MASTSNVQKTLERIKGTVESGSYYEAQQMYKSVYHRHKARRQIQESYAVLHDGATTQLRNGQITCGVELGLLLVGAYTADKVPAEGEAVQQMFNILDALPSQASLSSGSQSGTQAPAQQPAEGDGDAADIDEASRFVLGAIKWCSRSGGASAARDMHSRFARYIYQRCGQRGLGRATLHFIRGPDMQAYAEAVSNACSQGPQEEAGLWLLRSGLLILSVATKTTATQQLAAARAFKEAFTAHQAGRLGDTAPVHLTSFLLTALERRSHDAMRLLYQKYANMLTQRDASFAACWSKAEAAFFHVPSAVGGGLGGILGGLLKSLTALDGLEEEEEEEEEGDERRQAMHEA